MCGIAGILKLHPGETVDEARLKRMREVLRHRGPDGEGLYLDGPIGLGHRRLSIVDVACGHQPMANEDGTLWITFNGEIYNHAALRPTLETRGHRYRTRSDTETILHLYEEEGERCVERLQGMFAFALWDGRRQVLLLARDRLGIKPLYYAITDRELLFASEIKAILAAGVKPVLDESVLPEFLATRFVAGEKTFFLGIQKLLPGRSLVWSSRDGLRQRRYWQPVVAADDRSLSMQERAKEVDQRLHEAVRSHLMSDVPLGLFLSGGLDSSGLAALMAPMMAGRLQTFAVGFEDADSNELAYARLAAGAVGAEHREIVVSPDGFFGALPRLIWHEDEPIAFPSSVPLYFVSRLAREHVKVVLTGEGADELFLGYAWYRLTAWNSRLGGAYGALVPGRGRDAVRSNLKHLPGWARHYVDRTFLALEPGIRSLFFENFAVFPERLRNELLPNAGSEILRSPYREQLRCFEEGSGSTLDRMSRADVQTYLVELLMKQDRMSMAASVESRVPFLDHVFVEHVLAIPDRFKVRGWTTKAVLREALRTQVPRQILTRRKMGFPVPFGRWVQGPFRHFLRESLLSGRSRLRGLFDSQAIARLVSEHEARVANHADRLWLLLNFEMWMRIFIDGEEPPAVPSE